MANDYTNSINTTAQKALKAIQSAERSKLIYIQIPELTGHKKDKNPLTQVDIGNPNEKSKMITLTTKSDIAEAIIVHNQHHARQFLATPFAASPELSAAVDTQNPYNHIEDILNGEFIAQSQQEWIKELSQKVNDAIDNQITCQDFINFFK